MCGERSPPPAHHAMRPMIQYAPLGACARYHPRCCAVQTAIYRRMTPDQRTWAAAEMSAMARAITLENIRARHPEYDEHQARMALYRLLVGDELFLRAWPAEPLLAP
jgi:hypothetical protein